MRTAELHRALGLRTGDPAFEPEPVTGDDVAAWKARVRDDLRATFELVEQSRDRLPAAVRDEVQVALGRRDALQAAIDAAAAPLEGLVKTRYHGDYHLGQVLLTNNDFLIIDFEGEPARPLAERRAKHSALRDVAGMLRSLSYARWSALERASRTPEDVARLAPLAAAWEAQARREFVAGYDAAARGAGLCPSLGEVRGLLELFELEKALYELRYEINNRPAWARIPLAGISALAGGD